jgi:AmmeMemoRadiSam system protein A
MSGRELGPVLLRIARCAIGERLGLCGFEEAREAALQQHFATFVTLKRADRLRGCVGSLQALRPVGVDVRENAIAAAFRDPRFAPLAAAEFDSTSVEVSLLSGDERIDCATEDDLVARLRPGVDGLILEYRGRRATLLPQAWEGLAGAREFLAALKLKAGLPKDFWNPDLGVWRYAVVRWREADFEPADPASGAA